MEKENNFMQELKIKGMVDDFGHYVEMTQVRPDKKEFWIWNDGAITSKGFKRDIIFNCVYKLIYLWRKYKLIWQILIVWIFFCLGYYLYNLIK